MKIQFISDIHLEFDQVWGGRNPPFPDLPVLAPVLALLGDIGMPHVGARYRDFLESCARKFETVLVVAGNHEFYKGEYYSVKNQIRDICEQLTKSNGFGNVHFMDKNSVLLKDENGQMLRVIGATLWTHVEPEEMEFIHSALTDYRLVRVLGHNGEERPLSVTDTVRWHEEEKAWLESQIEDARSQQQMVVLVVHHPCWNKGTWFPPLEGKEFHPAVASACPKLLGRNVAAVLFGHSHYSTTLWHESGTVLVSNQVGYKHELDKGWTKYNEAGVYIDVGTEFRDITPAEAKQQVRHNVSIVKAGNS